jgi:hypothetical protein
MGDKNEKIIIPHFRSEVQKCSNLFRPDWLLIERLESNVGTYCCMKLEKTVGDKEYP